jgi:hypothetical protein
MNDQELREMIRGAIAKHLRGAAEPAPFDGQPRTHASHAMLPLMRGGDGDGMCLIEPAVRCNHCGYCLSYGH